LEERTVLNIFINGKKKDQSDGVKDPMTVDELAILGGTPGGVVREEQGESGKAGDPLTGSIHIKPGMHFLVTRPSVSGGCR
jgi:hypothetical protein